jgi:hypothetical protein
MFVRHNLSNIGRSGRETFRKLKEIESKFGLRIKQEGKPENTSIKWDLKQYMEIFIPAHECEKLDGTNTAYGLRKLNDRNINVVHHLQKFAALFEYLLNVPKTVLTCF